MKEESVYPMLAVPDALAIVLDQAEPLPAERVVRRAGPVAGPRALPPAPRVARRRLATRAGPSTTYRSIHPERDRSAARTCAPAGVPPAPITADHCLVQPRRPNGRL